MKILYDHQVFSLQDAGGASRYFCELARYMAGVQGMETAITVGLSSRGMPIGMLRNSGVKVGRVGSGISAGVVRYACNELICSAAALLSGKVDIYHPTLYRCMPAVRCRRVVATHHDCVHERFPSLFSDGERVMTAKRSLFTRADAIICVSEASKNDLLEFYAVDPAKAYVIHHGLSPLQRCRDTAASLKRIIRSPYLLYVGSRATYKNFEGLLQSFRDSELYRCFHLMVLGGGPLTAKERNIASKLEILDRIQCLPYADEALLGEAYVAAAAFVYPSLYEGFGFPPLEAMAAGCPVVVSHSSSLPEVCRDAPFYFDPRETSSLVAALIRATTDEQARTRATERGREVAAMYSWERCGAQTLALYARC